MYIKRSTSSVDSGTATTIKCGCVILMLLFNLLFGGWSINYLLAFFIGKTIPFIGAVLIGIIAGEVSIPIAVVIWLLVAFGVL